jgi:DNA-binding transcriptional MocR family regulator
LPSLLALDAQCCHDSVDGRYASNVIYLSTFSKILAPGLRIGFVAAPEPVIAKLAAIRGAVDRQGDHVLENAVAELERVEREVRGRRAATSTGAGALEALVRVLQVEPEALARLLRSVSVGKAEFLAALVAEAKRVAAGSEDDAAGPPPPTITSG